MKLSLLVCLPWTSYVHVLGAEGAWILRGKRDPAVTGPEGAQWDESVHTMHCGLREWKAFYPCPGIPYRVQIAFVTSSTKERTPVNQSAPYDIERLE